MICITRRTHPDACTSYPPSVTLGVPGPTGEGTPTELREAAKRILWHAKLLIVCTGLGFLVPFAVLHGGQPTYVASTRVLVSVTTDGTVSVADTVAAIVTSPSQLASALLDLGLDEDPSAFVQDVSVRALGDSGIAELSVTDEDRVVAASLANALGTGVVQVLRGTQQAIYPLPRILDIASASTAKEIPPMRSQDLALGALFGLVLGIGAASLIEALDPTLVGKEAIAAQLGAPVLGVLPLTPKEGSRDLPWVRWRLGAQAAMAGVATVQLTAAGPSIDLLPISAALVTNGATPPRRLTAEAAGKQASNLSIGILDALSIFPDGSAGLVVVTPGTIKRTDIESAKELLGITGWPAVGAIVYTRRGGTGVFGRLVRGAEAVGRKVFASIRTFAISSYRTVSASLRRVRPASEAGQGRARRRPPWTPPR